jgi:pimeloyl-ACP methyl ester carboxylesterase
LAEGLRHEFRLIYADHRGQGASDKPHDVASYAIRTRVGDAVAILDELGISRAHFLGFSWGARLGFAAGEHASDRFASFVLCGNQPYAWATGTPMVRAVAKAVEAGVNHGIEAFVETWEASIGDRFPEPGRTWMLENDPLALAAAFRSVFEEGPISQNLARWTVPCLIYCGADDEMHDNAERAAREIPNARFISLSGHTHYSAERVSGDLLPHVRDLFRSSEGRLRAQLD